MDIRCFTKSIFKWVKRGCKLVPYRDYWRRRQICKNCSMDWSRCPVCGCWLWLYCRLVTSECKHWRTINKPSEIMDFQIDPTED